MIGRKNGYRVKTAMGYEIEVIHETKEGVAQKLTEFEAKYGMTSKEFIAKYNSCQFEEERTSSSWIGFGTATRQRTSAW